MRKLRKYTCSFCTKPFQSRGRPKFCSPTCSNGARFKNYENQDEKEAIIMYERGMTIENIAHELDLSSASIRRAFKRNNIKTRKRSESYKIRRAKIPFSPLQEQLIYGSLLGDACLYEDNYKSRTTMAPCMGYRLSFGHSAKQIDYLLFKHKIMGRSLKIHTRSSGFSSTIKYFTYTDGPRLAIVASKCLCDGKKKITTSWLDMVGAPGIAFWYQDDGCYVSNENVFLCTESFSRAECDDLISKLSSLGIKAGLSKRRSSHNIRLYKSSISPFFNMIKEWIIPSMAYKIKCV